MRFVSAVVALALSVTAPGSALAGGLPRTAPPSGPAESAKPAPQKKPRLGVVVGKAEGQGVRVVSLVKDALAEKIGMMPNDILLEVDGARITSVPDFVEKVNAVKPGEMISIRGLRDEKEVVFSAKLL